MKKGITILMVICLNFVSAIAMAAETPAPKEDDSILGTLGRAWDKGTEVVGAGIDVATGEKTPFEGTIISFFGEDSLVYKWVHENITPLSTSDIITGHPLPAALIWEAIFFIFVMFLRHRDKLDNDENKKRGLSYFIAFVLARLLMETLKWNIPAQLNIIAIAACIAFLVALFVFNREHFAEAWETKQDEGLWEGIKFLFRGKKAKADADADATDTTVEGDESEPEKAAQTALAQQLAAQAASNQQMMMFMATMAMRGGGGQQSQMKLTVCPHCDQEVIGRKICPLCTKDMTVPPDETPPSQPSGFLPR